MTTPGLGAETALLATGKGQRRSNEAELLEQITLLCLSRSKRTARGLCVLETFRKHLK